MAEKQGGIGRLLKLALDALETGDVGAMDPKLWAYEARGNMTYNPPGLPKSAGKIGSSNFGVVVNVCELVRQRDYDRARVWLAQYFDRQGPQGDLGHCLLEPLSTTYGEAHIASALIAYALGTKEAGAFLERELALCLLHRCPSGDMVSASTRSGKTWRQGHREEFTDLALRGGRPRQRHQPHMGGKGPHHDPPGKDRSLIERAFGLQGGWRPPTWYTALGPGFAWRPSDLESVRFASGPLVVTHHENGHVSRWETGPLCYASPLVAVAVSYRPVNVRYVLYPGKTAAPFGELTTTAMPPTRVTPHRILVGRVTPEKTERLSELDISDLGPVVAEYRFEEVKKGGDETRTPATSPRSKSNTGTQ